MSDVVDGQDANDPNTDAGFTAALASAAGVEVPVEQIEQAEQSDTSISAGLTGLEGQPRDDQGRFAGEPAAQESGEETSAEGPAEGQPAAEEETTVDPALAAYLEKHGGDANAALEAALEEARNAQSLIGRQGNEVGELRRQLDQLQGYVEALSDQASAAPAPDVPLVTSETVEGLENLYEQQGARGMMAWVADNRPDLIDTAIEVWAADDPVNASRYAARYEVALAGETTKATTPQPQVDPILESMRQERAIGNAIDQARADLQIGDEDWLAVRDQITPAFEDDTTPSLIKNAVVSADPQQQLEGMKALMQLARTRAVAAATAAASTAAAEEAASRKTAAKVITGSLRPASPVSEGKPVEEMSKEERSKAFKDALLKTEVTSVADGLTGLK